MVLPEAVIPLTAAFAAVTCAAWTTPFTIRSKVPRLSPSPSKSITVIRTSSAPDCDRLSISALTPFLSACIREIVPPPKAIWVVMLPELSSTSTTFACCPSVIVTEPGSPTSVSSKAPPWIAPSGRPCGLATTWSVGSPPTSPVADPTTRSGDAVVIASEPGAVSPSPSTMATGTLKFTGFSVCTTAPKSPILKVSPPAWWNSMLL